MKKQLCIKQIYDDFLNKVYLTDIEEQILELYVKNMSIVKIADITNQSTSNVSRTIATLKEKYENYKKLEIAKLQLLKQ